jgi:hypothetical protein
MENITNDFYNLNGSLNIHHHHMALQPNSGPGLTSWGIVTITFLQSWIVSPAPNPQPGGPGLHIYDPRRQGGPAILPGTRYPFLVAFYDMNALQWGYSLIPATTRDSLNITRAKKDKGGRNGRDM